MADLRDSLLRAMEARMDAGYGMSMVAAGMPWDCCLGATDHGPAACTCWQPVYDVDQADPDLYAALALTADLVQPDVRNRMCRDCAYRPDSPERSAAGTVEGSPEQMEALAETGTRFWCHDGMRQPTAWRHPKGIEIPAVSNGDYQPPILGGIPYRADGQPGLLCAGWDARRKAIQAKRRPGTVTCHE